jgi:hypothetical protein
MSASKNINAEKIQGNLDVNGLSATTVNVNNNYSLPNTAGTDGQVLAIDGGAVVWSSVTKTILNVSIGTNDQIPFMNSTPNDFDYSSDLIFDGSKLRVTDGGDYVDIFDYGNGIELYNASQLSKLYIKPGSVNYIYTNTKDLRLYANNTSQMVLENNNPYVGINIAPSSSLHVKATSGGISPFLVENSVGDKLLEVTSTSLVKISDAWTLPNNTPIYKNVIVADGAGGSSWEEQPLDDRWSSDGVSGGNYTYRGRVSSFNYRILELNYTGDTNNPNTFHARNSQLLTLGGGNTWATSATTSTSNFNNVNIGTGNTYERRVQHDFIVGDDNLIAGETVWEGMFPGYTFMSSSYGYPRVAGTAYSWDVNEMFNVGDNNKIIGYRRATILGSNNSLFGIGSAFIGRNNSGFTQVDTLNEIHNIAASFVMGDNNMMGWSDQILIGFNTTTVGTNSAPGIFFGYGPTGDTANPSAGFVHGPDVNSTSTKYPVNFAMGGVDVFNSASTTTSIIQDGSGSGIFYLYRDSSTVEPSANMPSAVALFAKESPRGVVGLVVKDESGTYNLFSDTVSLGFTGGTAMLEVKSKGDTDSTDALNIKNSNDVVGLKITDGLDVYMPNLPITPGGLSAGGLYVDTATNTIKVV